MGITLFLSYPKDSSGHQRANREGLILCARATSDKEAQSPRDIAPASRLPQIVSPQTPNFAPNSRSRFYDDEILFLQHIPTTHRQDKMKFLKVGRVAIITRGRYAGKKVRNNYEFPTAPLSSQICISTISIIFFFSCHIGRLACCYCMGRGRSIEGKRRTRMI